MKTVPWTSLLENGPIQASAPCRIDMGGTLDLGTFHYPLRPLAPCTVNIALNLKTRVTLVPHTAGRIQIRSIGFEPADVLLDEAPFDHPLGLMFAVASYFGASGVGIEIDSASPPRSALGGSSTAALALVAAFSRGAERSGAAGGATRAQMVRLAHGIESAVAGVPCGMQDQLAAAYGGVNGWYWQEDPMAGTPWRRQVLWDPSAHDDLARCLLVAYCGIPHESRDINGRWVRQFLAGGARHRWREIVACTHDFTEALAVKDLERAAAAMNRETAIRREMTPDVLDPTGQLLVADAMAAGCGARFAGAGGGGCIWALGPAATIGRLRGTWDHRLNAIPDARLLDVDIDGSGVMTNEP
ncbi:MAG: galactokinase [Desulfobacterales bacterium]|nr:galactokinase [Desulfobacterales bacterium]